MGLESFKLMIARLQLEKVRLDVSLFFIANENVISYLIKNKGGLP